MADVLADPTMTHEQLAELYGVSAQSVMKLTEMVKGIDIDAILALKPAQEPLHLAVATKMALNALRTVDSDAQSAVRYAFGAKLATESAKIASPGSEKPGVRVLAFIQNILGPQASPGHAQAVVELKESQPSQPLSESLVVGPAGPDALIELQESKTENGHISEASDSADDLP